MAMYCSQKMRGIKLLISVFFDSCFFNPLPPSDGLSILLISSMLDLDFESPKSQLPNSLIFLTLIFLFFFFLFPDGIQKMSQHNSG